LIIVNADDFGQDSQINRAILQCFRDGLCSSASLMATMPGFEEACALVRQANLTNHVGLHLVLRDGFPLTEPIKKIPIFCDSNGCLSVLTARSVLSLSGEEKRALAEEIRAQISRCRKLGVPLTHVDSHYHLHTNMALARVLVGVMREQGLCRLRISRNCGRGIGMTKRIYKNLFNDWLRRKGVAATKYFGSPEDFLYLANRDARAIGPEESVEIMIHPVLDDAGEIVDRDAQCSVTELMKKLAHHDQAVSFGGHKYV
jgi:predicted glycoside hydrolase/deacetylase ChbG (UPF0249 family)